MEKLFEEAIKNHWIWLMSLVVQYEENNEIDDDSARKFYNWCIRYHKPLDMKELED